MSDAKCKLNADQEVEEEEELEDEEEENPSEDIYWKKCTASNGKPGWTCESYNLICHSFSNGFDCS